MVTVACSCSSSSAAGLPTMSLRPTTTARLPATGMRYRFSSSRMPAGVHGRGPGSAATRLPTLHGWKPSTSFDGATASSTRFESTCGGSGNCTRMPSRSSRAFSAVDGGQQLARSHAFRRPQRLRVNPQVLAGLDLVANVDFRGRIISHQHYGESGGTALGSQGRYPRFQLGFDFIANAISVEDFGHSLTIIACAGRNSAGRRACFISIGQLRAP